MRRYAHPVKHVEHALRLGSHTPISLPLFILQLANLHLLPLFEPLGVYSSNRWDRGAEARVLPSASGHTILRVVFLGRERQCLDVLDLGHWDDVVIAWLVCQCGAGVRWWRSGVYCKHIQDRAECEEGSFESGSQ